MDWLLLWTAVYAIATCILAVGVIVAFRQISQAKKSTNAQIAVELFKQLRDKDILDTLRNTIYNNDRETLRSFATGRKITEVEKIGRVLDWLDMLAVLVRKDIVDKELAIMGFAGAAAVRSWYQLVYFIREMQLNKRGFYAENYEDFVHCCIETFEKDGIEVYMKNIKGDVVKLIQALPKDQSPRSLEKIKQQRKAKKKQERQA